MKRILITSLFVVMLPVAVFSQQHISYAYDASGNRTQRQVTIQRRSMEQQKSLPLSANTEQNAGEQPVVCRMQENDRLTIKAADVSDAVCNYAVYQTGGALVCSGVLHAGMHTVINMDGYAPGVYVVTTKAGDRKHTWKVTKK